MLNAEPGDCKENFWKPDRSENDERLRPVV